MNANEKNINKDNPVPSLKTLVNEMDYSLRNHFYRDNLKKWKALKAES